MQLFISPDNGIASRRCDAPGGFACYAAPYGPRLLCIPLEAWVCQVCWSCIELLVAVSLKLLSC